MGRAEIIEQLQKQILNLQGQQKAGEECQKLGLGAIELAFAEKTFPKAAIHELISLCSEEASCTNGFISVLLGMLMQKGGCSVWISNRRKIYPPALKTFGIDPEQILFIDVYRMKDILWTIEEALKCDALTAVIGEISELSFNDSRRLQLAVEKSKVTGFIHRQQPKLINTVACATRWKITPLASSLSDEMPGVGFPRWDVELLKVRNGKPGRWQLEWTPDGLRYISEQNISEKKYERKTA